MGPWDPKSVALLIYLAFNKIEMELNGAAIFHSIHYERYFKWTSQQFGQMKTTNDGLGGMKEEIKQWNSIIYFW